MKFALRSLLKSPGFTAIALLTLALGIGVNTSMYSLIDTLMFRAAPFPRGQEIHQLLTDTRQGVRYSYSHPELLEILPHLSGFSSATIVRYSAGALAEPGKPAEQVYNIAATADIFTTFGVQPMLGRAFTAAETEPGKNNVIVLSYAFWQQRFAGSPDVIGKTLRIDGEPVTIIGVMPASFDWRMLWGTACYWRPLNYTPEQITWRPYRAFQVFARMKPGFTPRQAAAELGPVAANQLKDFPQDYDGLGYKWVDLAASRMDDESNRILWMLLGLSAFVLLIACANLANLQLARATTALREFAIRSALGASRWRLVREQLTECILLSLAGGVLGVVFALWMNRALASMIHIADQAGGLDLPIDLRVLTVTFGIAALTGVIFGIVPALLSSRTDVVTTLKAQGRGTTSGRGHHLMRQLLVIGEVTLALVLLGGAAVMQRGFAKYVNQDVGWDTAHVLTGALPLPEARFPTSEKRLDFFRKVQARLTALPGVEEVALSTNVPIWGFDTTRKIFTEKQAAADQSNLPQANHAMITAGFFKVIGVRFVEGHDFPVDIKPEDPKVIIVNETLARQLWPGQSALGQRLASIDGSVTTWSEVIGVVRDCDPAAGIVTERIKGTVFRSVVHEPWTWIRFAIRAQNPDTLIDSVRRAVGEVDPDLPANDLSSVQAAVDRTQHNLVVVARLLDGFALLGLVLSSVGLYGVISNVVAQRTSEFGIRLALGAKPGDVLNLVLSHGLKLTAVGLVVGFGGAYGLSRLLNSIMPRLVSPDFLALGAMAAALFAVAALACFIPARRATKVDPMIALRAE